MPTKIIVLVVILILALLWLFGNLRLGISVERFNNMQPVDFHASMLNKYQDYVKDNTGMKNRDYVLESVIHS